MGMNPRLLRPIASGFHPEARDWANRVTANGGSVSSDTLRAVDGFCRSVTSQGLRPLLLRVNLMCGSDLNACLVPLYRASSLSASPLGNSTDTNNNFASGDYSENSGLVGNGSTKRLITGLNINLIGSANHGGCFVHTRNTGNFSVYIRAHETSLNVLRHWALQHWTAASDFRFNHPGDLDAGSGTSLTYAAKDFVVGASAGSGAGNLRAFVNGTAVSQVAAVDTSMVNAEFIIFARRNDNNGTFSEHANGRIGGYTLGQNLTNSQMATYSTIWDTFLKAVGRR
jgi:hypothetical protein